MRCFALTCVLVLFACPPNPEENPPALDCSILNTPGLAPADTVTYAPEHMLCVRVTLDEEDFETLRSQQRDFYDVTNVPCSVAFDSPFTYVNADVDVDGVTVENVGVRNKGFAGSVNPERPSLKFDLDRFVDGQELGDTERITLNNNSGEHTRVRTCLGYFFYARAGLVAPQCNLASVVVNGEPFGAYTHIEPMKKRFLRRAFGDDEGSLYEATLTDFHVEWLGRFEVKTSSSDPSFAPLVQLANALDNPDDTLFLRQLGGLVDVDHFMRYWAVEIVINHLDGYSGNLNNYFVYFDPGREGRGVFLPWSVDLAFVEDGAFGITSLEQFSRGRLTSRLSRIETMRMRLEAEINFILDEVWDETALLDEVDRASALVRLAQEDPEYDERLEELKTFIRERPARVRDLLRDGFPARERDTETCLPFG